jgi:hypothetical protein
MFLISWNLSQPLTDELKEGCKLSHEKQRKCLALSECIVAISKKSFTPFHLGLALQIHHLHGLKYLMETLNAHGFGLVLFCYLAIPLVRSSKSSGENDSSSSGTCQLSMTDIQESTNLSISD